MIIIWGREHTYIGPRVETASISAGAITFASARGNIDYDQLQVAVRHGTGTKVQMNDGVPTTPTHLASYDTTGNVVDSGIAIASVGSGSVTSVGLALPAIFTVTVSPITTAGTLTATLATQSANLFFAGPLTSTATPTFRLIDWTDLPIATSSVLGVVKPDTTTITVSGSGILSAVHTGTVTSVAMTVPTSVLSIGGTPITASGTLALTLATQTANLVWAGPTTGSAATPTFRALVNADMPGSGAGSGTVTSVAMTVPTSVLAIGGTPITASGTLAITLQTQTANLVWAGPTTGAAATPTFRALVSADLGTTLAVQFSRVNIATASIPSGGGELLTIFTSGSAENGIQIGGGTGGGAALNGGQGGYLGIYTYTGAVGSETYALRATVNTSGNLGVGTGTPATSNGSVGRIIEAATATTSGAFFVVSGTPASNSSYIYGVEARSTGTVTGDARLGQIGWNRITDVTSGKISSQFQLYVNNDGTLLNAINAIATGAVTMGGGSLLVTTGGSLGTITADGAGAGVLYVSKSGTVYGALFADSTKVDLSAAQAGGAVPLTFDVASAERARFDSSGNFIIGATAAILTGTIFNVKLGTNANSTGQPSGTWATVLYNATNTAAYNGLFVKNNYRASTSTTFEVGVDVVGGAYESHFKIDGAGMISCPGNVYTTVGSLPAGPTGGIYYCPDAKNLHDDSIAVGTVAVTGGHGAYVCYINGSWRTMC